MLRRFTDTGTGETFTRYATPQDRSRYRLKLRLDGVRRIAAEHGLTVHWITLTLDTGNVETVSNAIMDKFLKRLRRRVNVLHYAWVSGIQTRRSDATGTPVLHWHVLTATDRPVLQDDIAALWGKGYVKVERPRSEDAVASYMVNRIEDEAQVAREHFPNLRRFGSSQLGFYAHPAWAWKWRQEMLAQHPEWATMNYRKRGGTIGFYNERWEPLAETRSRYVVTIEPDEIDENADILADGLDDQTVDSTSDTEPSCHSAPERHAMASEQHSRQPEAALSPQVQCSGHTHFPSGAKPTGVCT